jgi:phage terminase Nu1 subunit (DNA packaging protein)
MTSEVRSKVGNLPSELRARLRELEAEHVDNDDGTAHEAREALVVALEHYHGSR